MQDQSVRIEGRPRIKSLSLSPGEEALDIVLVDISDVAFWSDVLGKQFQDLLVLFVG